MKQRRSLDSIVSWENNVNCTTLRTASEGSGAISLFETLVNLSKFALSSKPERYDAIQRIEFHLKNYDGTEEQRNVLKKVIEILEVE